MSTPKHGLGRGLGALLGDTGNINDFRRPAGYVNPTPASVPAAPAAGSEVLNLPVDSIRPNPRQPRMSFDRDALEALSISIRNFGLIQPITVRRTEGGAYEIISGERRFRAARIAGLETIPAYVRDADDEAMLAMAIVENIQRQDLDPIEEALSYRRLIEECHLTQEQMADRIGKKRASVTNSLRLLRLPAKVQHDLKVGLISVGHAKVLLSLEDPILQEQICDRIIRDGLSVRQTEERVKRVFEAQRPAPAPQELPDAYVRVLEQLGRYFEDNISLKRGADGRGTMTVRFTSDEQMQRFLDALENSAAE